MQIEYRDNGSRKNTYAATNPALFLTIHETDNTNRGADADAHARLQASGNVRAASWHYQADDRRVIRSYPHTVQCWHAGADKGNRQSIGVEVCVNADGDYAAAVRNAIELARIVIAEEGIPLSNVVLHRHWSGKRCARGIIEGRSIDWAGFLAALRDPSSTVPVVTPAPTPSGRPTTYAALEVDGYWGPVTTRALQVLMAAITRYGGDIDGDFGPLSVMAVQAWLTGFGWYKGLRDGVFGPLTKKALQSFLRHKGLYAGTIDGDFGPLSVKALQRYLNSQRQYLG